MTLPGDGRLLPTQIARGGSRPGWILPAAAALALALACIPVSVLFTDSAWVAPALVTIAVVCGIGGVLRALPIPLLIVPLAQSAAFAAVMAWLFGGDAGGPWQALLAYRDLVTDGVADVRTTVAPVETTPEFLALLSLLVFLAALLLETLAVGMGLAGLSGLVLLLMAAVPLGIRPSGSPLAVLLGPGLGWTILMAADYAVRLRSAAATSGTPGTTAGRSALGTAGLATVGVATTAIVFSAIAPTTAQDPWLRSWWNGLSAPASQGALIDPFVSVESQLRSRSTAEVLRYTSSNETPTYLGMVTLESFDGAGWTPYPPVDGPPLTQSAPSGQGFEDGPQYSVDVGALSNAYLPIPDRAETVVLSSGSDDWRWDPRTDDVASADSRAAGTTYRVATSESPTSADAFDGGQGAASAPSRFTRSVPVSVLDPLTAIATDVTAGAGSDYERAVALQEWFTASGGFNYSLDVPDPQGRQPLLAFLEDRVGFCQQFATGMAAMARSLGIPARVVVGFTGGEAQPDGTFVVTASDAHAWPELWFESVGWVRFEPTPALGTAAVEPPAYTPTQPEPVEPPTAETPEPLAQEPTAPQPPQSAGSDQTSTSSLPQRLLGLAAIIAVALALLAIPSAVRARRRGNRLRRSDGGDTEAAWDAVRDAALDAGVPWPSRGTLRQQAAGVSAVFEQQEDSTAAAALRRVLADVEAAHYAPAGVSLGSRASVLVVDEPDRSGSAETPALGKDVRLVVERLDGRPRAMGQRTIPMSVRPRQR